MDAYHVVLADQAPGQKGKGGHDDALAQAKDHRRTHDVHPFDSLLGRKRVVVTRGEHGDLVTAPGQGRGQPLDIDCQAADMRVIVGQYHQDFHDDV